MKAVILAGGEGTRLRPLSVNRPKPMVSLFEKPVLEHTLNHLKRHGITEMIFTLQAMPHVITDYFGNGAGFGVEIANILEQTPLGTAGAVRACSKYLGGEPFVVISGDGVCDYNLNDALTFHAANRASVTILLARSASPMSYGLVMTDITGKITRFIEKPSWGQVFTDAVNTGIYIINPEVLSMIPQNAPYDFAKDLFPELLKQGAPLYGFTAPGYWCDIGDTSAYLQCAFDVLDRRVALDMPSEELARGIWSASAVPSDTVITPPCYIGSDVKIGSGVRLGPYAVINSGAVIEDGASILRSYVESSMIGYGAELSGAIVCRGSVVGNRASLREGCVLGDGVSVGENAVLTEDTRVWPGKEIESGARVSGSISTGYTRKGALFDGHGCITGRLNIDLTPDFVLRLGAAAAVTVSKGEIALSWQGGDAARLTASVLESGITAAGRSVTKHDAPFPACAAFAAGVYHFSLTVFVSQIGGVIKLYFYGSDGLPIERSTEQKIESTALRGELTLREARGVGSSRPVSGITALYEMAAAEPAPWFEERGKLVITVRSGNTAEHSLYHSLLTMPLLLRSDAGLPQFRVDAEGFTASAVDEKGRMIPHERLLAMLCLFEASRGNRKLAVPYSAPVLLDYMGAGHHLNILRVGRDTEARALLSMQPYMRDGVFMLSRLAGALITCGETLAALNDALPPFSLSSVELPVEHDRGAVMRALAEEYKGELVEGLRARVEQGWVHITPLPGRRALKITAEGATAEYAAELCRMVEKRAHMVDM